MQTLSNVDIENRSAEEIKRQRLKLHVCVRVCVCVCLNFILKLRQLLVIPRAAETLSLQGICAHLTL